MTDSRDTWTRISLLFGLVLISVGASLMLFAVDQSAAAWVMLVLAVLLALVTASSLTPRK